MDFIDFEDTWDLCIGGLEHEFEGDSRICYYCKNLIPEIDDK